MLSFTEICEIIDGDRETEFQTEFDLTKCSPMIDSLDNGKNRLVVYLPLDDANNPEPEGIGEAVIELIESYGYTAEFADELDNQAIISSD